MYYIKRHTITNALAVISIALGSMPAHAIVGGHTASITQYPYQVMVQYYNHTDHEWKTRCGGTIIAPNYILTASHCTYKHQTNDISPVDSIRIVAAVSCRSQVETQNNIYKIAQIVPHSRADVAIVRLTTNITIDNNTTQIIDYKWDNSKDILLAANIPVKVYGWGRIDRQIEQHKSDCLKYIELLNIPNVDNPLDPDNDFYAYWSGLNERYPLSYLDFIHYMSKQPPSREGAGPGDSGSPVTGNLNGENILVGILSGGNPYRNDTNKIVSAYSRIKDIGEWIAQNIEKIVGPTIIKPHADSIYRMGNDRAADSWQISKPDKFTITPSANNKEVAVRLNAGRCDSAILTAMYGGVPITKKIYACDSIVGPDTLISEQTYSMMRPVWTCDNWELSNKLALCD